jgi:hypothetical protein
MRKFLKSFSKNGLIGFLIGIIYANIFLLLLSLPLDFPTVGCDHEGTCPTMVDYILLAFYAPFLTFYLGIFIFKALIWIINPIAWGFLGIIIELIIRAIFKKIYEAR